MNDKIKHKTVGELTNELLANPDTKQGVVDTRKEMEKTYLPEVQKCINNHKDWKDPYYIIVINKRERLLVNAMRQYFLARLTLPTPDYDQTVFKYFPASGDLKFLWTVPDMNTIGYLIENEATLPSEQAQLIKFCKLFMANKLDKECGE
jgi:hypothetical protein